MSAELWEVDLYTNVRTVAQVYGKRGWRSMMMSSAKSVDHANPKVQLVADKGRLVRRVTAWGPDMAARATRVFRRRAMAWTFDGFRDFVSMASDEHKTVVLLAEINRLLLALETDEQVDAILVSCRAIDGAVAELMRDRIQLPSAACGHLARSLEETMRRRSNVFEEAASSAEHGVACYVGRLEMAAWARSPATKEALSQQIQLSSELSTLDLGEDERRWQAEWLINQLNLRRSR